MPWYDISSIPWLTGDTIDKVTAAGLRGAQTGAIIAQSFERAKESRRQDEENQRQAALMPLRLKLLANQQRLSELGLETELSKQSDFISAKAAFTEMATAAADISNRAAWADPKSEAQIWAIAAKHPAVVNTPEFRNITSQFDIAGKAVIAVKDAETRAQAAADRAAAAADRTLTANERNQILKDQIAFKDLQIAEGLRSKEGIAERNVISREKIAEDANEARIESAWAKARITAKDKLSEMGYRAFSEELDNITRDTETTTEQKRFAIRKLHQQAEKGLYRPTASTDFPAPTANEQTFPGELEARAAGKKAGDSVIILLDGKRTRVRLK